MRFNHFFLPVAAVALAFAALSCDYFDDEEDYSDDFYCRPFDIGNGTASFELGSSGMWCWDKVTPCFYFSETKDGLKGLPVLISELSPDTQMTTSMTECGLTPGKEYWYMASYKYADDKDPVFTPARSFVMPSGEVSVSFGEAKEIGLGSAIIEATATGVLYPTLELYKWKSGTDNKDWEEFWFEEESRAEIRVSGLESDTEYCFTATLPFFRDVQCRTVSFRTRKESDFGSAVDLGLSVKWRSVNLGAMEESGWGTKFGYETTDPVTARLGGNWRLPTEDEWKELFEKCTVKYDKNSKAFIFKSKTTGNSITVPKAYGSGTNSMSSRNGKTTYVSDTYAHYLISASPYFVKLKVEDKLLYSGSESDLEYLGAAVRPVLAE